MAKQLLVTIIVAISIVVSLSACVEQRYYKQHRHHSPEYIKAHGAVIIKE